MSRPSQNLTIAIFALLACSAVAGAVLRDRLLSLRSVDEDIPLVPEPQIITLDCSASELDEMTTTASSAWEFVTGMDSTTLHHRGDYQSALFATINIDPGHSCVIWIKTHHAFPITIERRSFSAIEMETRPTEVVDDPVVNGVSYEDLLESPLSPPWNGGESSRFTLQSPLATRMTDEQNHARVIGFKVRNTSDRNRAIELTISN